MPAAGSDEQLLHTQLCDRALAASPHDKRHVRVDSAWKDVSINRLMWDGLIKVITATARPSSQAFICSCTYVSEQACRDTSF